MTQSGHSTSQGGGAASLSSDSQQMLEKRLAQFKSAQAVISVARRMLQKCPGAADRIQHDLDASVASTTASQRLWLARRLLVRTVSDVLASAGASNEAGMPKKLENYLSFLDLAAVVASCSADVDVGVAPKDTGVSARIWRTFLLKEFDVSFFDLFLTSVTGVRPSTARGPEWLPAAQVAPAP